MVDGDRITRGTVVHCDIHRIGAWSGGLEGRAGRTILPEVSSSRGGDIKSHRGTRAYGHIRAKIRCGIGRYGERGLITGGTIVHGHVHSDRSIAVCSERGGCGSIVPGVCRTRRGGVEGELVASADRNVRSDVHGRECIVRYIYLIAGEAIALEHGNAVGARTGDGQRGCTAAVGPSVAGIGLCNIQYNRLAGTQAQVGPQVHNGQWVESQIDVVRGGTSIGGNGHVVVPCGRSLHGRVGGTILPEVGAARYSRVQDQRLTLAQGEVRTQVEGR